MELYFAALPGFHTRTIKSQGQAVTCEIFVPGKTRTVQIVPPKAAWEKFWKAMDSVQLWKWQKRYEARHIMDGLVWSVDVQRGSQKVRSGGQNAFPSSDPASTTQGMPSELFGKYQEAVQELIGRKIWDP